MAAYSGTPTINKSWVETDKGGKTIRVRRQLSITLSSQGGAINTIGYAALGFADGGIETVHCIRFTDGSNQIRWVGLFTDGDNVYVADPTQATDADRGEPSDVTGTLVMEIAGWPNP